MSQLPAIYNDILTKEDLCGYDYFASSDNTEPAAIRAAANPDPRKLLAILELGRQRGHGGRSQENAYGPNIISAGEQGGIYNSPLLQAINSGLAQNVTTCLNFLADPDGMEYRCLDDYAAWYYRYRTYQWPSPSEFARPLWNAQQKPDLDQLGPLTEQELNERSQGLVRFWTDREVQALDIARYGDTMPSLVAAAKMGSIEVLDQLMLAGADASFWTQISIFTNLPTPSTMSSLAVNTPLHASIRAHNRQMVQHLLSVGFNPNVLPLATPTQATSPLICSVMETIPHHDIIHALLEQPQHLTSLKTPVYGIHVHHVVAARRDLALFHLITPSIPLSVAGATAVGHSLLHTACLPASGKEINIFAEAAWRSVHEVRDLGHNPTDVEYPRATERGVKDGPTSSWSHLLLASETFLHRRRNTWEINDAITQEDVFAERFPRPTIEEDDALSNVLQYLLDSGTQNVRSTDYHGNTALHYLAAHMHPNEAAIDLLRSSRGGLEAWKYIINCYGYSAEAIYKDCRAAVPRPWMDFWAVTNKRNDWSGVVLSHRGKRLDSSPERESSPVRPVSPDPFHLSSHPLR